MIKKTTKYYSIFDTEMANCVVDIIQDGQIHDSIKDAIDLSIPEVRDDVDNDDIIVFKVTVEPIRRISKIIPEVKVEVIK